MATSARAAARLSCRYWLSAALLLAGCKFADSGDDSPSRPGPGKGCKADTSGNLQAVRGVQLVADAYVLKPGADIRLALTPADQVVDAEWTIDGEVHPHASGPAEAVYRVPLDVAADVDIMVRINRARCDSAFLMARLFHLPSGPYVVPGPVAGRSGMVEVPGGPVLRGKDVSGNQMFEFDRALVSVSTFWMDGHEVTQKEYRALMGTNPSYHDGDALPVENVTWAQAADFCNRRSRRDGLQPVYDSATGEPDFSRNGYRLPTSMEWQRAAQAGFDSLICDRAEPWSRWSETPLVTAPAADEPLDRGGIRGLFTNVAEWTGDWQAEWPRGYFTLNPVPARGTEHARAVHGYRLASYTCEDGLLWAHTYLSPDSARPSLGFRTVIGPFPVAARPPSVDLKIDTLFTVNDTVRIHAEVRGQSPIAAYTLESTLLGGVRSLSGPDTAFPASAAFAGSPVPIILRVVDSLGRAAADTVRIRIRSSPPEAVSGPRRCHAPVDGRLHLSGRALDDGHIVRYEWNLGPGGSFVAVPGGDTTLATAGRTLGDSTHYILRATDNHGEWDVDTTTVIWVRKWEVVHRQAPFPAREGHQVLAYAGRMWVIGGRDALGAKSDVWSSADGVVWEQATAQAAFGTRFGHAAVVFDDRMWVIGGSPGPDWNGRLADVWHSTDGKTWTAATTTPAFRARTQAAATAYAGKIWLVGGLQGVYQANGEVWSSPDGVQWTLAYSGTHQSQVSRYGHYMGVLRDEMLVVGGTPIGSQAIGPIRTRGDAWAAYTPVIGSWTSLSYPTAFVAGGDSAWALLGGYLVFELRGEWSLQNSLFFADGFDAERLESTYAPPYQPTLVRFGGRLWMIGGNIKGEYRDRANVTDIGDVMYWRE